MSLNPDPAEATAPDPSAAAGIAPGLRAILDGCLAAVDEEAAAVRGTLAARGIDGELEASGGHHVDSGGGLHAYEWRLPPGAYDIRPDDSVQVETGSGDATRGFVIGYDRASRRVAVSVPDWLGAHPGPARLAFDPTWLLECLADRLRDIGDDPADFHPDTVLRAFARTFPTTGRAAARRSESGELNESQRDALARILGSEVQFVWGPPGTGKTRLLGHAAAELARWGRVLVVATTNAAVDEAAARSAASLGAGAVRANRIVRFGSGIGRDDLPELSLDAAVDRAEADLPRGLADEIGELERALRTRPGGGARREGGAEESADGLRERIRRVAGAAHRSGDPDLAARAGRVASELHRAGLRILRKADVVLTTFAALTTREELRGLRFHSVLIDEASTAPLPYVVVAAARAANRAVAVGDFQQLPPIVVARDGAAARWLGRDLFQEAGVVTPAAPGEMPLPSDRDRLCAMLTEQYRMRPPIRRLVSELFYGGRLRDAAEIGARELRLAKRPRGTAGPPLEAMVLLDTTRVGPAVERVEGSRANPAHADAVIRLLEVLAREGVHDVAVVAPYRVQVRRLRGLVRARLGRLAPAGLEIATIHRFQGREKGVVVFDTVDAPPSRSWFLDEGRNPDFPRLLNVALSRARDLLVVVGTPGGLERVLPSGALLHRVVETVATAGWRADAARLLDLRDRLFGGESVGLGAPRPRDSEVPETGIQKNDDSPFARG